jgi:hypothetical protein
MAADLDAREIVINYEGGSLSMTVGNAKNLFGEDATFIGGGGDPETVSVKSHTRTRVIGGPSTNVAAYSYTFDKWPAKGHGTAAGGEPVAMSWDGSEGEWISRVSGAFWSLATFLEANSPKNVYFTALGGKTYGPFKKAN